jgi:hypothetical protein
VMVVDWPLVLLISPSRSLPWIGIDWYDNPNQYLYCWTLFFNTGTFRAGIKCGSIKFTTLEIPSLVPMYIRNFVRKVYQQQTVAWMWGYGASSCNVSACLGLDKWDSVWSFLQCPLVLNM